MKKRIPTSLAGLVGALLVVGTSIALTQAPEAHIKVVAWSPVQLEEAGLTSDKSSGLSVVGVGELVYLQAEEAGGEEITSFTWAISKAPAGSAATLDSTNLAGTTFRPDLEGKFDVTVTITTASGQASDTITITASTWAGVGDMGGLSPDVKKGQCATCHSGNAATWHETGHATFFPEAIDGLKSSHYNGSCIECHTVGYNESAVNGGFDDVAEELGWTFPDTLKEGNWDDIVTNYPELANLSSIQCENCHGPGSLHYGDKNGIDISLDAGVCATCHEEAPYHVIASQWRNSQHALGTSFARGTSATCAPCHSGWGFIAKVDPTSDLDQKTGNQNISCAVCHDPHDATYSHQLRTTEDVTLVDGEVITFGDEGKLCMNCHHAREEKVDYLASNPSTFRGPHHSVQADVLAGTKNVWNFGRLIANSTHKDVVPEACVTCHMSGPALGEPGYEDLGNHSWRMDAEVDGEEQDNVTACRNCHDPNMESFEDIMAKQDYDGDGEIEPAMVEVEGLLENVALLLPPRGEPEVDNQDTTMTQLEKKAFWNYLFIEEDRSSGVHNFAFAVSLLQVTEQALAYGVLEATEIASIKDVPNDNGKQVEVRWTRFGGDGPTDEPVQMYHVWRKSEAASKAKPTYTSLRSVPATALASNASVAIDGDVWTAVASQPAAGLDTYSAIAPTLYDSTAADGVHLSYFKVSGHTANTQVYVETDEASGYSIDNLAPRAPGNLVSKVGRSWIHMTWDEPTDEDFDYFVVYRGTEPGFNPDVVGPRIAVTSPEFSDEKIDVGMTYYYRVAAYDFSGNRSTFSAETSPNLVTAVENVGGVPEVFALHPNYPNPFNPSTLITYDVPVTSEVSVVMYDVVGRVLKVLVEGQVPAGSHKVTIDAANLPSGLYLVRMVTPDGVYERTITLLR